MLPGSVSAVWIVFVKAAIVAFGGVIAMLGNPLIRAFLRRIDRAPVAAEREVDQARANLGLVDAQRELPGGRWIGVLERLAVYACILTGFTAGIALALAVKGLGRYAELATGGPTSRKGELFIIGTFASLLWASAWAGMALLAIGLW